MGHFPFFVDLSDKQGLIVGGGRIALGKIRRLLPYDPRLTVAAPAILEEIETIPGIILVKTRFSPEMLEDKYFVIAATSDREVNHQISGLCREQGLLVNVVDDKEACTFLFPSLVKRGKLSVGISTEGASPSAAIYLKEQISTSLPDNIEEILEFLDSKRQAVRERIPEEKQRARFFSDLFRMCMEREGIPTEEEWFRMLLERGRHREE